MTIKDLIQGCVLQRPQAQRALFDRYGKQMMYVAYRYCGDHTTAQDAVQESFIRIFQSIEYLRQHDEKTLLAWMRKITAREALRALKKYRISDEIDDHHLYALPEHVYDRLQHQELMKLLSEIPAGYRQVIQLYVIEGFNHKEISDMLSISESTSRSQLTRARKYLYEAWDKLNRSYECIA